LLMKLCEAFAGHSSWKPSRSGKREQMDHRWVIVLYIRWWLNCEYASKKISTSVIRLWINCQYLVFSRLIIV
jgi:hypothetical protein